MKNYYYILGVSKRASLAEIKTAYRKLSLKFHPDKNDGDLFFSERFKEIQEAYETLSDIRKRKKYNSLLFKNQSTEDETQTVNINFFRTEKLVYQTNDIISFIWKTENAQSVIIKPFGKVNASGSKSYKLKKFNKNEMKFELVATGFFGGIKRKNIVISNANYEIPNGDINGPSIKKINTLSKSKLLFASSLFLILFLSIWITFNPNEYIKEEPPKYYEYWMQNKECVFWINEGLYYHTNKFYAGLSAPNLLQTDHFDNSKQDSNTVQFLSQERINFYFITGYVFDLNGDFKFKPALLTKVVGGAPLQVDFSANFMYNDRFTFGAAYRWDAALSGMVGFQISDQFMVGLAYDRETTDLGGTQFNDGSFEVFLRYELIKSFRRLVSPRFF